MRKRIIIIAACVSLALAGAYILLNQEGDLMLKAVDGITVAGVINVCAALLCHVKNDRQFRAVANVRRKYRNSVKNKYNPGKTELNEDPETPEQKEDEHKKWDPIPFYIVGLPFVAAAVIMILVVY